MRSTKAIVVLVFFLLLISSSFISSSGPADGVSGDHRQLSLTRNLQNGGTALEILPSDTEMITRSDNLSFNGGSAWEIEKDLLVEERSFASGLPAGNSMFGSRSMKTYEGSTFIGFTRGGDLSGFLSFWLTRYDRHLDYWEEPVLVENYTGYSSGQVEITVHQDQLFYIFSLQGIDPSQSMINAVTTPVEKWHWVSNSTVKRVDDAGNIHGTFSTVAQGSDLLVFWARSTTHQLVRGYWRDGKWEDALSVMNNVGEFSLSRYITDSGNRLYIIHSTGNSLGLNVSWSASGGVTWGSDYVLLGTSSNISSISSTVQDGRMFSLSLSGSTGIAKVHYTDDGESWSGSSSDISLSGLPQDGRFDGQISADRSQVVAAIENNNAVELHISEDRGVKFRRVARFDPGSSDPFQTAEKDMLGFFDGSELRTYRYDLSWNGIMTTGPISPIGIVEWNDLGFDVAGNEDGATASFRIWNHDLSTQIFPESGWKDMASLPGGKINDRTYDSYIQLEGDWTAGTSFKDTVRIEIRLERDPDNIPALERISINYTTDFPISSDLNRAEYISSRTNCTFTNDGLMLVDGAKWGQITFGPVEREDQWCDVIHFSATAITSKVSYRLELLDLNMDPIKGFEEELSTVFSGSSVNGYARWENRFLSDLPENFDIVNIRFIIETEVSNGRPVIESISLEYSQAPSIQNVVIQTNSLFRGQGTDLIVTVEDREDPVGELRIEMFHMGPGETEWSGDLFKGQMMKEGKWHVPFVSNYGIDTGQYYLKLKVTDSMGIYTEKELDEKIQIMNNLPAPPFVYIDTDRVVSGDSVDIVIHRPGSDLETPEAELTYNIKTLKDGETFEVLKNFTEDRYVIEENMVNKGETWNIAISTFDGLDESMPYNATFTVENSLPDLKNPPMNLSIIEDSIGTIIDIGTWFQDHDEDVISYSITNGPGINAQINELGQAVIDTEKDFFGTTFMVIAASDGSGIISHRVEIDVEPVNDPPVLSLMGNISMLQGESLHYYISASDGADQDQVSVSIDINEKIPGLIQETNFYLFDNGSFILNSTNEMIGSFKINVTAFDGKIEVSKEFTLEISNINEPPTKPVISMDPPSNIKIGDGEYTLTAVSTDPDMPWGDKLQYKWTSDLQGELGTGSELMVDLEPGLHTITVEVSDEEGEMRSSEATIEVVGSLKETEETMRTSTLKMISSIIGLLAGIIIGVVILVISIKKKNDKNGGEEEDENVKEKEEPKEEGSEENGGEKDE